MNEKGNHACDNDENNSGQKIYVSMARMSGNENFPSENFGDSSQLTDLVLDSGTTCHMIPEVSDFIPGSLKDTDKYIEVANGHHNIAKGKGKVQIKCATTTERIPSQHYTMYFWYQTYVKRYFKSLNS